MTAPTRRVLRYEVPVDDRWHKLPLAWPDHVATRRADVVEVWSTTPITDHWPSGEFRVYGTGHSIEEPAAVYVGTAIVPGGEIVWHLFVRHAS